MCNLAKGTNVDACPPIPLPHPRQWLCFDACPVNACLDYTAARMAAFNPDAKLIFMLRDPVSGAFSAEIMVRRRGAPAARSASGCGLRPAARHVCLCPTGGGGASRPRPHHGSGCAGSGSDVQW